MRDLEHYRVVYFNQSYHGSIRSKIIEYEINDSTKVDQTYSAILYICRWDWLLRTETHTGCFDFIVLVFVDKPLI